MPKKFRYSLIILFFLTTLRSQACQCPLSNLSLNECAKYELIFRGKIVTMSPCNSKSETVFQVQELYKGNSTAQFKLLVNCTDECATPMRVGDEWIIYTNYYQMENAKLNWCSRSRKLFKNDKEDFYTVTYGNTYEDEVEFLQKQLGLHKLLKESPNRVEERNIIPNKKQFIIILLVSISGMLGFYYAFIKLFKM